MNAISILYTCESNGEWYIKGYMLSNSWRTGEENIKIYPLV
jgi:hypothetical protein